MGHTNDRTTDVVMCHIPNIFLGCGHQPAEVMLNGYFPFRAAWQSLGPYGNPEPEKTVFFVVSDYAFHAGFHICSSLSVCRLVGFRKRVVVDHGISKIAGRS